MFITKELTKSVYTKLDKLCTEDAIEFIKLLFQEGLTKNLNLRKVSAPLFLLKNTGINDDLNGIEKAVSFAISDLSGQRVEIVHSLAKWKRLRIKELGIKINQGLYCDMHALRPDEHLSNIHSVYVDQWDWEKNIYLEDRNLEYLKQTVEKIYKSIIEVEKKLSIKLDRLFTALPEKIKFIHSEDLLKEYPTLNTKARENMIAKRYGAVFIIGIGGNLLNGNPHDGRAPDYDD